ncbi:hypothetical protein JOQ06_020696 [Pogonophryne albipinna]|uniref:Uncharacterized protein n=1 Tax=Pogonophryne albipinna TaxID=1090488 RepID=A0AAD6BQW5_9TELE|nr:hypothetical protein JOQ06_020696 [Pogonophryne albipinna]
MNGARCTLEVYNFLRESPVAGHLFVWVGGTKGRAPRTKRPSESKSLPLFPSFTPWSSNVALHHEGHTSGGGCWGRSRRLSQGVPPGCLALQASLPMEHPAVRAPTLVKREKKCVLVSFSIEKGKKHEEKVNAKILF